MTPEQFRDMVIAEEQIEMARTFNAGAKANGNNFMKVNGLSEARQELRDLNFYLRKEEWDKGRAIEELHRALSLLDSTRHSAYGHVSAALSILEEGKP